MPTEGWKETARWKRKFRVSVKFNVYWKPCICLKFENADIEKEGVADKTFLSFWNLSFQNVKMEVDWTYPQLRNKAPLSEENPPEIKNVLTFPKKPKFQNSNSSPNLGGGWTLRYHSQNCFEFMVNFTVY